MEPNSTLTSTISCVWGEEIVSIAKTDAKGNISGGSVQGIGLKIFWQDGPVGHGKGLDAVNGTFVETVIQAVISRLEFYEQSGLGCHENARTIAALRSALDWQQERTDKRKEQKVEGTYKKHDSEPEQLTLPLED